MLCNEMPCPAVLYLLAWIASAQTAAPRNDLWVNKYRH